MKSNHKPIRKRLQKEKAVDEIRKKAGELQAAINNGVDAGVVTFIAWADAKRAGVRGVPTGFENYRFVKVITKEIA